MSYAGSFVDFSVQTRAQFKDYIAGNLGYPLVTVELADSQYEIAINDAIETYSKYAVFDEQYLAVCLSAYVATSGVLLPNNVMGIFSCDDDSAINSKVGDVNRLFSVPNITMNMGMMPLPYSDSGWSWTNYEMAMQYVKMTKKYLGGGYQIESYNPRSHLLRLIPDPVLEKTNSKDSVIVFGCNTMRPTEQQYGEQWVKRYALACAKVILGKVRNKFKGVQLPGGANIDESVGAEGAEEKRQLLEVLQTQEQGIYNFYIG